MKKDEWSAFCKFRKAYKQECIKYLNILGYSYTPPPQINSKEFTNEITTVDSFSKSKELFFKNTTLDKLQKEAARANKTPDYNIETPIVYNHNWDKLIISDEVKLILVGDNPGKNEQLHKNQTYLVGQAGKLADNFFKQNTELNIDFRKNVIILNKTPIHTAKTKELSYLLKNNNYSDKFKKLYEETQFFTATKTIELQKKLNCPIWLIGYGELKKKGLFNVYSNTIKNYYSKIKNPPIFLFQHFSMNRFIIDYKEKQKKNLTIQNNLKEIGIFHRKEILNF